MHCLKTNVRLLLLFFVFGLAGNAINAETHTRPEQLFRPHLEWVLSQQTPPQKQYAPAAFSASVNAAALNTNPLRSSAFDERLSDVIAANALEFTLNFAKKLSANFATTPASDSQVFSPVSVLSALSLLMLGAKGKSYEQLHQLLLGTQPDAELLQHPNRFHEQFSQMLQDLQGGLGADAGNTVAMRKQPNWRHTQSKHDIRSSRVTTRPGEEEHFVRLANGLFAQNGRSLNPDYSYIISTVYRSELNLLDFQRSPDESRAYINDWVNKNTYGKIPVIINDDLPRSTSMIMASVVYFKAFWQNAFFDAATVIDNFYPDGPNAPAKRVPMMATGGIFPYYESPELDCRILGLPYKGNLSTMYVLAPMQSTRAKLRDFQARLTAPIIEHLIASMTQQTAVLVFPKMHLTRNIQLKNLLSQLGVHDIFANDASDLSLIDHQMPSIASHKFAGGFAASPQFGNDYQEKPFIFSTRFGGNEAAEMQHKMANKTAAAMTNVTNAAVVTPTTSTTSMPITSAANSTSSTAAPKVKRQAVLPLYNRSTFRQSALERLEANRNSVAQTPHKHSDLFVEEIVHKVDFDVNEYGTEAAAATATYLRRSGTDVMFRAETPFLLLIRHDPTKLILFYGIINEPEV